MVSLPLSTTSWRVCSHLSLFFHNAELLLYLCIILKRKKYILSVLLVEFPRASDRFCRQTESVLSTPVFYYSSVGGFCDCQCSELRCFNLTVNRITPCCNFTPQLSNCKKRDNHKVYAKKNYFHSHFLMVFI